MASSLNNKFSPVFIRTANLDDLDRLVDFDLDVKPHDPAYPYCFPYRHEFPDDLRQHTRLRYEWYLSQDSGDWHMLVAETQPDDQRKKQIVGCATWNMACLNQESQDPAPGVLSFAEFMQKAGVPTRRDADHKRMTVVEELSGEAMSSFKDKYGADFMYIRSMHVRQEYWRRGIGSRLAEWGLSRARKEKVPVVVIATEVGQQFYSRLGFKTTGSFTVQLPGESDNLVVKNMAWEP